MTIPYNDIRENHETQEVLAALVPQNGRWQFYGNLEFEDILPHVLSNAMKQDLQGLDAFYRGLNIGTKSVWEKIKALPSFRLQTPYLGADQSGTFLMQKRIWGADFRSAIPDDMVSFCPGMRFRYIVDDFSTSGLVVVSTAEHCAWKNKNADRRPVMRTYHGASPEVHAGPENPEEAFQIAAKALQKDIDKSLVDALLPKSAVTGISIDILKDEETLQTLIPDTCIWKHLYVSEALFDQTIKRFQSFMPYSDDSVRSSCRGSITVRGGRIWDVYSLPPDAPANLSIRTGKDTYEKYHVIVTPSLASRKPCPAPDPAALLPKKEGDTEFLETESLKAFQRQNWGATKSSVRSHHRSKEEKLEAFKKAYKTHPESIKWAHEAAADIAKTKRPNDFEDRGICYYLNEDHIDARIRKLESSQRIPIATLYVTQQIFNIIKSTFKTFTAAPTGAADRGVITLRGRAWTVLVQNEDEVTAALGADILVRTKTADNGPQAPIRITFKGSL